eukprot:COSAG06_NODE_14635_length_1140_cov_2.216138_1_plen_29_part_10
MVGHRVTTRFRPLRPRAAAARPMMCVNIV